MLPSPDSTQGFYFLTKSETKKKEGDEREKKRALLKSNQLFSGLNWWTNSLKNMCVSSAPTSKEEKVRISASLVGAGRGNGATAERKENSNVAVGGQQLDSCNVSF